MAKCEININKTLSTSIMNNCIESYIGSKRYLKSVVPMFMCNIIYNRIQGYDDYFENREISTLKYKIFKPKLKNHLFADIYNWIKSAMKAFEDSYLKDLYLFAKDNKTDAILESYKFSFTYETKEATKMPTSAEVVSKTQEILEIINTLNKYDMLPNDVKFEIEITYNTGTPVNYEVEGFEKRSPGTSNVDALTKQQYNEVVKMGNIYTGYHKMKCVGQGKIFELQDSTNDFIPTAQSGADKGEKNSLHLTNDTDIDICTINETVTCPCDLILDHKNQLYESVICEECSSRQHIYCLGYKEVGEIGNDFLCTNCNTNPKHNGKFVSFIDKSPEKQRILAILRMCAMYLSRTEKVPYVIINKLSSDLQDTIWYELSVHFNIIIIEEGREIINKKILEDFIASNFNTANQNKPKSYSAEDNNKEDTLPLNGKSLKYLNKSTPMSSTQGSRHQELMSCPCELPSVRRNHLFPTTICNKCYCYQHIFCLGYTKVHETGEDFLCTNCNKNPQCNAKFISFKDDSPEKQRILALLRLCAMYSNLTEKIPHAIVNKLPSNLQDIIWNELSSNYSIVKIMNGREVLDKEAVDTFIKNNFYNSKRNKYESSESDVFHSDGSIMKRCKYNM